MPTEARAPVVSAAPPEAKAPPPSDSAAAREASPQTIDPRVEADLLVIANDYESLTRADGTSWAPFDCRAPTHPAFASHAETGPHGRKLYTLFIKDYASYAALSGADPRPLERRLKLPASLAGMSQVIVKEAWTPVPSSTFREECPSPAKHSYLDEVKMDGTAYRACEPAGLFVMYRPPSGTYAAESTDDGWLYGTVQYAALPTDAGRAQLSPHVTATGRVASCMRCHDKAPHGRLFGLASGHTELEPKKAPVPPL